MKKDIRFICKECSEPLMTDEEVAFGVCASCRHADWLLRREENRKKRGRA